MSERVQKQEIIARLAQHMDTDSIEAEMWLDTVTDTLYKAFREGRSVTLPGFG